MSGTPMTRSMQAALITWNVIHAAGYRATLLGFAPPILIVDLAMVEIAMIEDTEDEELAEVPTLEAMEANTEIMAIGAMGTLENKMLLLLSEF